LANFTQSEIKTLYHQHTEATGQVFVDGAVERTWYWSQGQPWLVNALAKQVIEKILKFDYSVAISAELIDKAAEDLFLRQDAHIDSLFERLKEPKVRRVMEPVIIGAPRWNDMVLDDDIQYVFDLGLLKKEDDVVKPANPIYQEVILRKLASRIQNEIPKDFSNQWVSNNLIEMTSLIKNFQQFWRENAEVLGEPYQYTEATPHLVCMAFLQKALNGRVDSLTRESALGRERLDLLVKYKGRSYPVELKVQDKKRRFTDLQKNKSLSQLRSYMGKCTATEGWLVIFDKSPDQTWEHKITWETTEFEGVTIHMIGC
jgi:hypothetical protein